MKCEQCGYEIENGEHYIELEDGTILDESCFFDLAVKKYNAVSKQYWGDKCNE